MSRKWPWYQGTRPTFGTRDLRTTLKVFLNNLPSIHRWRIDSRHYNNNFPIYLILFFVQYALWQQSEHKLRAPSINTPGICVERFNRKPRHYLHGTTIDTSRDRQIEGGQTERVIGLQLAFCGWRSSPTHGPYRRSSSLGSESALYHLCYAIQPQPQPNGQY